MVGIYRDIDLHPATRLPFLSACECSLQVRDCGIRVGEQQAPRLHCVFAAACVTAGLLTSPDGPQLYVGSSTETSIYCFRLPAPQRAEGWAARGSAAAPAAATLPRKGQLAAVRAAEVATLQQSRSAPLIAEPQDAVQPDAAEQRAYATDDARPHSGGGAPAEASSISELQLDRSRWRGGGAAAGGQLTQRQQQQPATPATALAVVITGAFVDLLQVTPSSMRAQRETLRLLRTSEDMLEVMMRNDDAIESGMVTNQLSTSMLVHCRRSTSCKLRSQGPLVWR